MNNLPKYHVMSSEKLKALLDNYKSCIQFYMDGALLSMSQSNESRYSSEIDTAAQYFRADIFASIQLMKNTHCS